MYKAQGEEGIWWTRENLKIVLRFKTVEMSNIETQIAEIKFAKGDRAPLLENFKQVMKQLKIRGFKATHPCFLEFKESWNKLPDIDGLPVYLLKQTKTKSG